MVVPSFSQLLRRLVCNLFWNFCPLLTLVLNKKDKLSVFLRGPLDFIRSFDLLLFTFIILHFPLNLGLNHLLFVLI
jgi:hypothetical protein